MHMIEDMTLRQEGLISHIPKIVRGVNMGDFADTYNGNIQVCHRGLVGGFPPNLETDRETCKFKWEVVSEGERAVKKGQCTSLPKRGLHLLTGALHGAFVHSLR